MSGFFADNSRILVTETVNSVDETVFDTDENMPHIIGTAYVANVAVDFTNLSQTRNYAFYDPCLTQTCIGYNWYFEFNSNYYWTYESVYVFGSWSYERVYDYWSGWSYGRVYSPGYTTYQRVSGTTYSYDRVFETVYNACCEGAVYEYSVDARELSTTSNLADLPVDEDGNTVDVDFIIVQATGSRTTAGKDPRFDQSFVTTVPGKTFSFQGSILLEASGKANGDSFFRRILSVYTSGSKVKLKSQESVAKLPRGAYDSGFPSIGSGKSTFSFNFKIFFGRFKT